MVSPLRVYNSITTTTATAYEVPVPLRSSNALVIVAVLWIARGGGLLPSHSSLLLLLVLFVLYDRVYYAHDSELRVCVFGLLLSSTDNRLRLNVNNVVSEAVRLLVVRRGEGTGGTNR